MLPNILFWEKVNQKLSETAEEEDEGADPKAI